MLSKLRESWTDFSDAEPGRRFQEYHEKRKQEQTSTVATVAFIAAGIGLILVGALLMVIPGPGIPVVAVGAGLIARESSHVAKALDWLELRIRAVVSWALGVWKQAGAAARAGIVVTAIALAGAAGYGAWLVMFAE
jgi:hypothetical protein